MLPRWLPMIHSRGGVLCAALLLGACQQGAGLSDGLTASAPQPPAAAAPEITAAQTQDAAEKPAAGNVPVLKKTPGEKPEEKQQNTADKPLENKPLENKLAATVDQAPEPAARDLAMATPPPRLPVPDAITEPDRKPEATAPPPEPEPMPEPALKPEPAPPPPPPPPLFDPQQAVGWSADGLIAEIGAADFIRAEGSMQVWQYRSSYCVADFFFYPKADQAELLILRGWHIRPTNIGAGLSDKTCFEELGQRL